MSAIETHEEGECFKVLPPNEEAEQDSNNDSNEALEKIERDIITITKGNIYYKNTEAVMIVMKNIT